LNRSSSAATSFHYSDLIKVQSDIEDHFKITCGINVSKLKLKAFEAPKVASINVSGKVSFFIYYIKHLFKLKYFVLDTSLVIHPYRFNVKISYGATKQ